MMMMITDTNGHWYWWCWWLMTDDDDDDDLWWLLILIMMIMTDIDDDNDDDGCCWWWWQWWWSSVKNVTTTQHTTFYNPALIGFEGTVTSTVSLQSKHISILLLFTFTFYGWLGRVKENFNHTSVTKWHISSSFPTLLIFKLTLSTCSSLSVLFMFTPLSIIKIYDLWIHHLSSLVSDCKKHLRHVCNSLFGFRRQLIIFF